ncbi:MAG: hypothetical protein ACI9EW_002465 [Cellvibrionaceae bacterium]|jgi:uncharacterized protein YndB with AHSA1/START domain
MSELILNISRTIKAPVESVYNAWLNPQMLAKFMIAGEGMCVPRAEADAREGGRFTVIMAAGEQEIPHGGEYKKLNPYSQIVFTWESPFSVDDSTVTLNLEEIAGGTNLELIHVRFLDEESRGNHEGGWNAILTCLDQVLAVTD